MAAEELVVEERNTFTDWKTARDILRDLRDNGARESEKVVFLGTELLDNYASKLGDEGTLLMYM